MCFHPILLEFYTDIDSEFRQQDVFLGVLKSSRLGSVFLGVVVAFHEFILK